MRDDRPGARQTHYELKVEKWVPPHAAPCLIWSSGLVRSDQSILVPYTGPALRSHTMYRWRVRLRDRVGRAGAWSTWSSFTTGFMREPWPADWVGVPALGQRADGPAYFLRREFELDAPPRSAHLYITALGLFEARANGQRVGADVLAPGWTDYRRRVEYLTYDVTAGLRTGRNVLGLMLAEGWYSGRLLWHGQRWLYGKSPAVRAALRLVLPDGGVRWINTDRTWKWTTGPILAASLYNGEHYDARRELNDWDLPGFNDRGWTPVRRRTFPSIEINAKQTPPIRVVREMPTIAVHEPAPGVQLFDFGQNLVGVVRLRVTAPAGTKVTLRHGEMLNADGTLYTANLRSAAATDVYVCRGDGEEAYTPRFTFHGFRYVEVTGVPGRLAPDALTGLVFHSDLARIGHFRCSDSLINRLHQNICWGQRGNFLDVPTDCPQRDERLGWTGDAQVFLPTAAFNFDVTSFFRKWLRDLRDGQHSNGSFPDVAPDAIAVAMRDKPQVWTNHRHDGNAAWADAGVVCPWLTYCSSGDVRVLRENYDAMVAWIHYQQRTSHHLLRPRTAYGDWLATDAVTPFRAPTPNDLVGTAYFARSTQWMAQTARVLGRTAEAKRFDHLHRQIVTAFQREYVSTNGRLAGDTQTGYLLALGFDLLPEKLRPAALRNLVDQIERNHDRLSTGFVGTPLLGPVLSRFGRDDLAYRLLFQKNYPSWLYPVGNGATTMWERWNSWTKENGFGDIGMNSFNHYAYGAIGEWIYERIGGIGLDAENPGYRHIFFRPVLSDRLSHATAELLSPYGRIRSAWQRRKNRFTWEIEVPANTTATAVLPRTSASRVKWNGKPQASAAAVLRLTAGEHRVEITHPQVHRTVVQTTRPL